MTNEIHTPFMVRELRGRVTAADDRDGWPYDGMLNFELRGSNGFELLVPIAKDGAFYVPDLRPGEYCFRTSSEYLQAYEGVIVIDRRAPPSNTIVIRVSPGV